MLILFDSSEFALGLFLGMLISKKISKDILSINIITKLTETKIKDISII